MLPSPGLAMSYLRTGDGRPMPSTGRVGSRNPPLALVPALVALVLGGGCGDQGPPEATKIEISPPGPVLQDAGDTLRLTATVRDRNGGAMPWVPVTWSVRDSFVVQLSEDGIVTAEEPGEAVIRAEAAAVRADATVTVEPGQRAVLHKIYRVMGGDEWKRNTTSTHPPAWTTGRSGARPFRPSTTGDSGSTELSTGTRVRSNGNSRRQWATAAIAS